MVDGLERRIARLEAAEEIRHLKARYAHACDTGYDPDRIVELFTEDATWDGGERLGSYRGRAAIWSFFDRVRHQFVWALHYMVAPVIEVAEDIESATGSWYLWQPCTLKNGDSVEAVWFSGIYRDRYRCEQGLWKISHLQLTVSTITPYDEGWARRPFRGE